MKRHQAVAILLLAAFVGNLVCTVVATDRAAFAAAVRIRPQLLGLAGALAVLPWFCNALRIYNWMRLVRPDLRAAAPASLRAVLAAEVGAAMTPTAVGGAPIKTGMLIRSGLTPAEAVTVTAAGGLEDLVVISISLPFALATTGLGAEISGRLQEFGIQFPEPVVLTMAAGVLAVLGLVVLLFRRRTWANVGRARLAAWWRETCSVVEFLRERGTLVFAGNLALAAAQWAARLSIISALLAGLGVAAQPLRLAVLQWICFAIMSVTPTPGAIGGAETTFLLVFADDVPVALAPVALAAWRFVTFYAVTGIAAVSLVLPVWSRRSAAGFTRPARATARG